MRKKKSYMNPNNSIMKETPLTERRKNEANTYRQRRAGNRPVGNQAGY